jgi:hypothetical protein
LLGLFWSTNKKRDGGGTLGRQAGDCYAATIMFEVIDGKGNGQGPWRSMLSQDIQLVILQMQHSPVQYSNTYLF